MGHSGADGLGQEAQMATQAKNGTLDPGEHVALCSLEELGARLHSLRFASRMTTQGVADKTGMAASTISRWERAVGKKMPDLESLQLLADLYGVSVIALITGADEGDSNTPGWRNHLRLVHTSI